MRLLGLVIQGFVLLISVIIGIEILSWGIGSDPLILLVFERILGEVCHHLPERTLSNMPVCARCSGLYVGWILGMVLGFFIPLKWNTRTSMIVFLALFLFSFLMALLEAFSLLSTSNLARLPLGIPLGLTPAALVLLASRLIISQSAVSQKG